METAIQCISVQVDKTLGNRLGERVRILRAQRQWSQEVLAELSGLHRNYIGHVERAEVNVGFKSVYSLAVAFELTVSEFLHGI